MDKVLVTVNMLTYNHRKFIVRALDSILSQRVNFRFEIVIGDDASTDGTQEIIRKYAKKYPDIIHAVLHTENVGISKNVESIRPFYHGKYIAPMEGDDYWVDSLKLQRQVDFLESHPEYSAIAAKVILIDENGNKLDKAVDGRLYFTGEEYTIKEFGEYKMAGQINTMLYRSFFSEMSPQMCKNYDSYYAMGDRKVNLMLLQKGNIYCENIVTTAYRYHRNSWTNAEREYCMNFYLYHEMLALSEFAEKYLDKRPNFSKSYLRAWYGTVEYWVRHPSRRNFFAVKNIFNTGFRLRKLWFLITHTLSFPVRKIKRRFINENPSHS